MSTCYKCFGTGKQATFENCPECDREYCMFCMVWVDCAGCDRYVCELCMARCRKCGETWCKDCFPYFDQACHWCA